MNDFARSTYEVARKEVLQHIRTKRLLIIGGLVVASLALVTLIVGPQVVQNEDLGEVATENFLLLVYFSPVFISGYFFFQLLAVVLTADAVCSEWSNKTLFLLLSKPVSRVSFVVGKYLGSFATVAATIVLFVSLDYAIMQGLYEGSPSGSEVAGFFGALGVLVLGAGAFAAMALFFSTITRSNVMALLYTLGMWIIVLPLLGFTGYFIELSRRTGDLDSPITRGWHYLNPGFDMQAVGQLLVGDLSLGGIEEFFSTGPNSAWLAMLALTIHIALWFGLSLVVVERRNFE